MLDSSTPENSFFVSRPRSFLNSYLLQPRTCGEVEVALEELAHPLRMFGSLEVHAGDDDLLNTCQHHTTAVNTHVLASARRRLNFHLDTQVRLQLRKQNLQCQNGQGNVQPSSEPSSFRIARILDPDFHFVRMFSSLQLAVATPHRAEVDPPSLGFPRKRQLLVNLHCSSKLGVPTGSFGFSQLYLSTGPQRPYVWQLFFSSKAQALLYHPVEHLFLQVAGPTCRAFRMSCKPRLFLRGKLHIALYLAMSLHLHNCRVFATCCIDRRLFEMKCIV